MSSKSRSTDNMGHHIEGRRHKAKVKAREAFMEEWKAPNYKRLKPASARPGYPNTETV